MTTHDTVDTLIVGAGPTGLALATRLHAFGARFRVVDRAADRARESRAFAVQARTLELLHGVGLGDPLVRRGNPGARLALHLGGARPVEATLGDIAAPDTRYPFILFVSQAITEAVLGDHLAAHGVAVERGVELLSADVADGAARCLLRHPDGREERVTARWVAGCDGAHSTVRKLAGIPFEGAPYPQEFVLGDVEIDGPLDVDRLHAFPLGRGIALLFPIGSPATWRIIASAPRQHGASQSGTVATDPLALDELQAIVDAASGGGLRLRDPAWLTRFRLHHRQAARYRAGPFFLAGDAAHIHSPVGGQGMNTGIQDAWNLGWKLALVARGVAPDALLDTYEAERWPVGRRLLATTDRAFALVSRGVAGGSLSRWLRRVVGRYLVPRVLGVDTFRRGVFHFVSQLGIRYRSSPGVTEADPAPPRGPRAGDRLPDAPVVEDGTRRWLHDAVAGPRFRLLLCGPAAGWDEEGLAALAARTGGLLRPLRLVGHDAPGALVDVDGVALARLGLGRDDAAQYLVRPDGYVAYRCAGRDLGGVSRWVERWLGGSAGLGRDAIDDGIVD